MKAREILEQAILFVQATDKYLLGGKIYPISGHLPYGNAGVFSAKYSWLSALSTALFGVARQALGASLPVDIIVRAGHDVEVAHLVDQRAGLRVGAWGGRPEHAAQVDCVGLGGVDVSVIFLLAAAVEFNRRCIHGVADGIEIRCSLGVAGTCV